MVAEINIRGIFMQKVQHTPEGVVLTTTLGGAIQTPMRAELCGTIAVLAAETEVHLAADNAGAVKGVKRAKYAIEKKRSFPCYRRPNADLWRTIWRLLLKHGKEAVNIRWTRAHATQQHIQQGTTTEWDARQNAKADAAAEEGRLAHGPAEREAALHYRKVLEKYRELVIR